MHHIYHTEGIILGSTSRGEANKLLTIYTRDRGLIRASAQGIRLAKSKLRFALQDFSYAKIDLVYGKDIWRVTSAIPITSFPFARTNKDSIAFIARISKLIIRLCSGEETVPEIFSDTLEAFTLLDSPNIKVEDREGLELYVVLRILNKLGYIGEQAELTEYLGDMFTPSHLGNIIHQKRSALMAINRALRESQL